MIRRIAPSEHTIQAELFNVLAYAARPDIYYFAIPNQSNRHINNAVRMKAEGVRSGIADTCFMFPLGITGWLELKTETGSLTFNQQVFRGHCGRLGHRWAMARSVVEAFDVLNGWGALKANARII